MTQDVNIHRIDQPWVMGNLVLKNRIVRSATVEGLSTDNGAPTQQLIDIAVALAKGSVGLIVAGAAYVNREGKGDKHIPPEWIMTDS